MKKIFTAIIISVLAITMSEAKMFQMVPMEDAQLLQSGKGKMYCPNCGMNLVKFYKTSHAVTHKDGSTHQYCSLHCLADSKIQSITQQKVVDVASLKFIDVKEATYVVGSSKKGTMTMNSKYAFALKSDAQSFAKANGGELMSFDQAFKCATGDLKKDNMMIHKKRTQGAKKGKMMFEKLCSQDKIPSFESIAEAKTFIISHKTCGSLKDKQYQAIALYLSRKDSMMHHHEGSIVVPKDAKCPVCGMFSAKYPKWTAEMKIGNKTHYFDGVKDMMKFYFSPSSYDKKANQKMISTILVSDYYTLKAVNAKKAWYVRGSNVYGPMGNELIPFMRKKDAQTFMDDHYAKEVLSFDKMTSKMVLLLDN